MKVFISWSGPQSEQVASALREWLPKVIQAAEPWMSSSDVNKGTRWGDEISRELESCAMGIICVTRQNVASTWLLFEAGALSKVRHNHVCTYLFGLDPADVSGPLALFQATRAEKLDTLKMVRTINDRIPRPIPERDLGEIFEAWWPRLLAQFAAVPEASGELAPARDPTSMLEEILATVRELNRTGSFQRVPTPPHLVTYETKSSALRKHVRSAVFSDPLRFQQLGREEAVKYFVDEVFDGSLPPSGAEEVIWLTIGETLQDREYMELVASQTRTTQGST